MRAQLVKSIEVLRSAMTIYADIFQMPGELSCISAGALADIIIVKGYALRDIFLLSNSEFDLAMNIRDDEVVTNGLQTQ